MRYLAYHRDNIFISGRHGSPSENHVGGSLSSSAVGSSKAEKACASRLEQKMRAAPHFPVPKSECWEDAIAAFPKLTKNGFERAWVSAIQASGAVDWKRPGRRKRL
jgi:hypothetical protein